MTGTQHAGRWSTAGTVAAAMVVAVAAGATTAHGLYEVAVAAQIPPRIAWLYPVMTDGLALVAYAATSRLSGSGRMYAWAVVVVAAGLSGLAQASYLVAGVPAASAQLRFGIGAWPAIAAAVVAHLLFLLGTRHGGRAEPGQADHPTSVQPERSTGAGVVQPERLNTPVVQHADLNTGVVQPDGLDAPVQPAGVDGPAVPVDEPSSNALNAEVVRAGVRPAGSGVQPAGLNAGGSVRERAYGVAAAHAARHGGLPTVSELMALAEVSRGTAGAVLKELREQRPTLHVVSTSTDRTMP